jgi:hypothetical protein
MTNRQSLGFLCVAALCGLAGAFFSAADSDVLAPVGALFWMLALTLGVLAVAMLAKNLLAADD